MRVILNVEDSDEGDSPAGQDIFINNKLKLEQALAQEILNLNIKELQGYDEIYISLLIAGADKIREINKNYRQCDEATDVLSFPMFEVVECIESESYNGGALKIDAPQGLPLMLGDIVICPQKTFEMHLDLNNQEALLLMLAHSLLHLLGWDHDTEERQSLMWARQDEIKDNLLKALSN